MHFINESAFSVFYDNSSFKQGKGYSPAERYWLELFYSSVKALDSKMQYCLSYYHQLSKEITDSNERLIVCAARTNRTPEDLRSILLSAKYRIVEKIKQHSYAFTPDNLEFILNRVDSIYEQEPNIIKGQEKLYWKNHGHEHIFSDALCSSITPSNRPKPMPKKEKHETIPAVSAVLQKIARPRRNTTLKRNYRTPKNRQKPNKPLVEVKPKEAQKKRYTKTQYLKDNIVSFLMGRKREVRVDEIISHVYLHKVFKPKEMKNFLAQIPGVFPLSYDYYYYKSGWEAGN